MQEFLNVKKIQNSSLEEENKESLARLQISSSAQEEIKLSEKKSVNAIDEDREEEGLA